MRNFKDIILARLLINTNGTPLYNFDDNKFLDDEIADCLMNMYFYILSINTDDEKKQEEYFKKFDELYNNLTKEQQEIIIKDYLDIIEAQENNKEKIKKKGND